MRSQCTRRTFLSGAGTLKIGSENCAAAHVFNLQPGDQGSLARGSEGSLPEPASRRGSHGRPWRL